MILHVSHNDLDGVGCGILIKKFLKDVTTYYCNYGEVDEIITENASNFDRLIITDLSPSREAFEEVMGEIEPMVIDHHQTSDWLKEYPWNVHDISKCGTLLTLEYLEAEGCDVSDYRDFADCVNDFDMWHLNRPDSLEMNMLFMKLGITRFEKRFLDKPYHVFDETERLIIDLETVRRDFYIKKASQTVKFYDDRDGLKAALVFAEEYNSELGNHIIQELEADYVLIINMQRGKASLRSRADVSISEIAEANGGGGHRNAAGFPISYDFNLEGFLESVGIL